MSRDTQALNIPLLDKFVSTEYLGYRVDPELKAMHDALKRAGVDAPKLGKEALRREYREACERMKIMLSFEEVS